MTVMFRATRDELLSFEIQKTSDHSVWFVHPDGSHDREQLKKVDSEWFNDFDEAKEYSLKTIILLLEDFSK